MCAELGKDSNSQFPLFEPAIYDTFLDSFNINAFASKTTRKTCLYILYVHNNLCKAIILQIKLLKKNSHIPNAFASN